MDKAYNPPRPIWKGGDPMVDAYELGYRAGLEGKEPDSNPYEHDYTVESDCGEGCVRCEWETGWIDGEVDSRLTG